MFGLGFAIVSARTRKLLKRMAVTPMRRSHYLLSFMLSRLVFIALQVLAIFAVARLAFSVEMRGSFIIFLLLLVLGCLTFSSIGLFLAARPRTTEGVSGLMNFTMLPMWLLSGSFFPTTRFPAFLQPIIHIMPLTALNDALRAVMNNSATLANTWTNVLTLIVWAFITFICAMRIFRWQ